MKNLVVLFAAMFSFLFVSCSDVSDNSLLTNPVMEKSGEYNSVELPSPQYPYSYLFNFSNVEGLKYLNLEGEDAVQVFMTESSKQYSQLYVIVTYFNEVSPKMFFINDIENESFKVVGVDLNKVQNINVYGLPIDNHSYETVSPFNNNIVMNAVVVNGWKVDNSSVYVECGGIWPSSLKFIFAEITTKDNSFFVFLQKPWSTNFLIPEYGKHDVQGIRLFGYQTLMEANDLSY